MAKTCIKKGLSKPRVSALLDSIQAMIESENATMNEVAKAVGKTWRAAYAWTVERAFLPNGEIALCLYEWEKQKRMHLKNKAAYLRALKKIKRA